MSKFFIDRPVFAWVIALFLIVLGGVAIVKLPIAQYPPVAPPTIVVSASCLASISPRPLYRWTGSFQRRPFFWLTSK